MPIKKRDYPRICSKYILLLLGIVYIVCSYTSIYAIPKISEKSISQELTQPLTPVTIPEIGKQIPLHTFMEALPNPLGAITETYLTDVRINTFFSPLKHIDYNQLSGGMWLRFSLEGLDIQGKHLFLNLGSYVAFPVVLYKAVHAQDKTTFEKLGTYETARINLQTTEAKKDAIYTYYISIPSIPEIFFAPILENRNSSIANTASIIQIICFGLLLVVTVFSFLRAILQRKYSFLLVTLFSFSTLMIFILGVPNTAFGFISLSSLPFILALVIAGTIFPLFGTFLLVKNGIPIPKPFRYPFIFASIFIALCILIQQIPSMAWVSHYTPLWAMLLLLCTPGILYTLSQGYTNSLLYLFASVFPALCLIFTYIYSIYAEDPFLYIEILPVIGGTITASLMSLFTIPFVFSYDKASPLPEPADNSTETIPYWMQDITQEELFEEEEETTHSATQGISEEDSSNIYTHVSEEMEHNITNPEESKERIVKALNNEPHIVPYSPRELFVYLYRALKTYSETYNVELSWFVDPDLDESQEHDSDVIYSTLYSIGESLIINNANSSVHISAKKITDARLPSHIRFSIMITPEETLHNFDSNSIANIAELISLAGGTLFMGNAQGKKMEMIITLPAIAKIINPHSTQIHANTTSVENPTPQSTHKQALEHLMDKELQDYDIDSAEDTIEKHSPTIPQVQEDIASPTIEKDEQPPVQQEEHAELFIEEPTHVAEPLQKEQEEYLFENEEEESFIAYEEDYSKEEEDKALEELRKELELLAQEDSDIEDIEHTEQEQLRIVALGTEALAPEELFYETEETPAETYSTLEEEEQSPVEEAVIQQKELLAHVEEVETEALPQALSTQPEKAIDTSANKEEEHKEHPKAIVPLHSKPIQKNIPENTSALQPIETHLAEQALQEEDMENLPSVQIEDFLEDIPSIQNKNSLSEQKQEEHLEQTPTHITQEQIKGLPEEHAVVAQTKIIELTEALPKEDASFTASIRSSMHELLNAHNDAQLEEIVPIFSDRPSIIVVDSSSSERKLLLYFLEGLSYALADVQDATTLILQHRYYPADLVILDVDTIEGDLQKIIAELHKIDKRYGQAPVLILALTNSSTVLETVKHSGAVAALMKPINREEFRNLIQQLLPEKEETEARIAPQWQEAELTPKDLSTATFGTTHSAELLPIQNENSIEAPLEEIPQQPIPDTSSIIDDKIRYSVEAELRSLPKELYPQIPHFLNSLQMLMKGAEVALRSKDFYKIIDIASKLATENAEFSLHSIEKIALCIKRAASESDEPAILSLFDELANAMDKSVAILVDTYESNS